MSGARSGSDRTPLPPGTDRRITLCCTGGLTNNRSIRVVTTVERWHRRLVATCVGGSSGSGGGPAQPAGSRLRRPVQPGGHSRRSIVRGIRAGSRSDAARVRRWPRAGRHGIRRDVAAQHDESAAVPGLADGGFEAAAGSAGRTAPRRSIVVRSLQRPRLRTRRQVAGPRATGARHARRPAADNGHYDKSTPHCCNGCTMPALPGPPASCGAHLRPERRLWTPTGMRGLDGTLETPVRLACGHCSW